MYRHERKVMWLIIVSVLSLAIADHFVSAFELSLSTACNKQTGYTEHKKVGRNWYCKASEWSSLNSTQHWQKLRRN